MKVAIVGGGISGLGAAFALNGVHDLRIFEQEPRLGGHANTAVIDYQGREIAVDTGFIVYNDLNYPNLTGLFRHLDVATQPSDMSFAFSAGDDLEWSSNGLAGLFAWKRNLARPDFLGMLADVLKFNARARADLKNERALSNTTLRDYVADCGLGEAFLRRYLLPMGAAIWSTPEQEMLEYPAASFLRFFDNHRLMHVERPKWRTVVGGSRAYVDRLKALFSHSTVLSARIVKVERRTDGVWISPQNGAPERFDAAILAAHSDENLAMLADADAEERQILGAVHYGGNTAYLHRDESLMPRRRKAWGAWNYLSGAGAERVSVTYWMNALQKIDPACPLFVSLNPPHRPDPSLTFAQFSYAHPQFDRAALAAQRILHRIQGRGGIWHAGAWTGYGFHEDGLASGLRAAFSLGGRVPWAFRDLRPLAGDAGRAQAPTLAAAE